MGSHGPKGAIRTILMNPRYTGRQVWNRQRKDEVFIDVHDVALGHTTKMRWNDSGAWIFSEDITHPPIIDHETFARARNCSSADGTAPVPASGSAHATSARSSAICGSSGGSWRSS